MEERKRSIFCFLLFWELDLNILDNENNQDLQKHLYMKFFSLAWLSNIYYRYLSSSSISCVTSKNWYDWTFCVNQGQWEWGHNVTIKCHSWKLGGFFSFTNNYKGQPQFPKISASAQNFLDPLPPSSKKGPTNENVSISCTVIISFFSQKFKPPLLFR